MDIKTYLRDQAALVEVAMARFMPPPDGPLADHIESMRYSLFAGGKRIRPILCLTTARALNEADDTQKALLPTACALEYIHTYSLIHDDLPAMDNDSLRRGQPTNHVRFGEAQAILAGDGLLTDAFALVTRTQKPALPLAATLAIIQEIANAAGSFGMVGGQALDIANERRHISLELLQTIHRYKTGALIRCAVRCGAIGAGASAAQLAALDAYGRHIGLGFQIVDDLLDSTSTSEQLGKSAGSDAKHGKATYPALFGIEETRRLAQEAIDEAIASLEIFDDKADSLRDIARYIFNRGK
ncbi:MAG: polyprenyl synthetase family protein [Desulfobulbaceae bacterium]|jgi:geranylgeranyl diphosphate synthase type II|nr:polyprenyl synthetase family protein [Desulfobulbaceae bacterium]